jgi:copper homeostasis protein
MNSPVLLEICADCVDSAISAERGGAHRVELCSGLAEGGVTPSSGLISAVRSRLSLPLHVIIRPRAGDFLYTADEFEIMQQDVLTVKQLGADGIVVGILREDGSIDTLRTRTLIEIARPMKVTFHRAFDMSHDFSRALDDIIAIGADRVLTSGGEQTAAEGIPAIAALVKQAAGKTAIMAGAGVTPSNVRNIIAQTGIREIHATARVRIDSRMQYRNQRISMGSIDCQEYDRLVTTEKSVSDLMAALANEV